MKKSAIVGVVVALGAVWTGTAWYTGQKAEAFVKQSIEQANLELKKVGEKWGVTPVVELVSFDRGVFSSTERYRIKFTERPPRASRSRSTSCCSSSTWTMDLSRCPT